MSNKPSKSFLDKVFQLSPNPISIVKADDATYVEVNDAFTKYFGLKRKEIIGKTPLELGLISAKERLAFLKQLKEKGHDQAIKVKVKAGNNRVCSTLFNTKLINIHNHFYYLSIGTDISNLALTQNTQQADAIIKSMNAMTETGVILVSHDKNNKPSVTYANTEAKNILKFHSLKKIFKELAGQESTFLKTPIAFHYVRNIPTHDGAPLKIILLKRVADGTCMTQKLKEFGLTSRQLEIASLAAHGHSNKQISKNLCISQYTVKDHLKSIFQIIGVNKRNDIFMKLLSPG